MFIRIMRLKISKRRELFKNNSSLGKLSINIFKNIQPEAEKNVKVKNKLRIIM